MTYTLDDLTVIICTLNEADDIVRCVGSLAGHAPLIVVDGGSTDDTVTLLRQLRPDVTVLAGSGGLLRQRMEGVSAASTRLIGFVDADDLLLPGALHAAVAHLNRTGCDAVQFGFGADSRTRMSKAYSGMLQVSHVPGSRLRMLGRPCVMRRDLLPDRVDAPSDLYAREDAWINETFLQDAHIEVADAETVRLQPSTFGRALSKTLRYGKGDAEHVVEFGDWPAMAFHLLVRYPVLRAGVALRRGRVDVAVLCVLVGLVRFAAALTGVVQLMVKGDGNEQDG